MYDKLQDLPVEKISLFTKDYTQHQLIQYLKKEYGSDYAFVADQLAVLPKAKKKLPQWVKAGCLFTSKSLEQCSSPALAAFKSTLIRGNKLIDLSGGLGVDDVFFSKSFTQVVSIDVNQELNELVAYNLHKLNINHVARITDSAENYLKTHPETVDVIYVDADRRVDGSKKSVLITDATPDVLALMPALLSRSSVVMLKLSPLIDITYLLKTLPAIQHIYVVGLLQEVKEVLVLLSGREENKEVKITAVQLSETGTVLKQVSNDSTKAKIGAELKDAGVRWFYEPSNMVIKAGLSNIVADNHELHLLAKNSHYMVGSTLVKDYFGRAFMIKKMMEFGKSAVKAYLKEHRITKANVSARNFVSSVDEIRKVFSIHEGGDDYLFFSTNNSGVKMFYHCVKPD